MTKNSGAQQLPPLKVQICVGLEEVSAFIVTQLTPTSVYFR
jgi:hypothetical protein